MDKNLDYKGRWRNKIIRSSAKTGEGIEELANFIENKTCAFVGKSGGTALPFVPIDVTLGLD